MKKNQPLIGAHVSSAGGIAKAVERAAEIGANCVQVFSGSPRSWGRGDLKNIDITSLKSVQAELGVSPIVTHGLYLINLASEKLDLIEKSKKSLIFDLEFDALIGGAGVVVHLGSHLGRGWQVCRSEVAAHLRDILANTPENSTLLIENSAGQKGKLCSDLSEVRELIELVGSERLKWCLDTCHAWAAGYGLSQDNSDSGRGLLSDEISKHSLWDLLVCVHVNDSRDPFASGRDRHENLGDGTIPLEEMRAFLNRRELELLPLILEVPGLDKQGPDLENINRLKQLLST